MNKYLIRFNKSKGEPGRGSVDHVWRVFENGREILAKHVYIYTHSWSEQTGDDWNIACMGQMVFHEEFQIAEIHKSDT